MKRSIFIIIGVTIIIILLAVWVYVLFFATPSSIDEQFANFGIGDTTDPTYQEPTMDTNPEPVVDVGSEKRLRQLTTKPVAGFTEVATGTSSPLQIRYVEAGTGHIYTIDLENGEEQRISGTTIPATQKAVFTKDGRYVMIEAGFGSQKEFIIGEINSTSSSLSNTALNESITSFSGTTDNRFLYSIQANASTIGKVYDPAQMTSETLFTLPFRESSIEWGSSPTDSHYVYPKTTRQLESFLYRVKNGSITRMPVDGYGMSALGNDNYVFFSRQEEDEYKSYYFDNNANRTSLSPLVQIPEKCTMNESQFPVTICANTQYQYTSLLPDSWYKGEVGSADNLWEYNLDEGSATLLVNTKQESGRLLDITDMTIGKWGRHIYFINQKDQTLWSYQRLTTYFGNNS